MRDRSHDPSHYERTLYHGAKSSSQFDKHGHVTSSATTFEGSDLLNDAHIFKLRLYGVEHMVKNHSDNEKGNPLRPHGLLFPISSKGSFISIIPQTGSHIPRPLLHQSRSTGCNEKQLNGSTMKDRSDDLSHHERTLLPRSYISLLLQRLM